MGKSLKINTFLLYHIINLGLYSLSLEINFITAFLEFCVCSTIQQNLYFSTLGMEIMVEVGGGMVLRTAEENYSHCFLPRGPS